MNAANDDYARFVQTKMATVVPTGLDAAQDLGGYDLMPHQSDLTAWALRRGRTAVFADTGLGKTRIQLAWADRIHKEAGCDVLILAPLAVAAQTVAEGSVIGVNVTLCREAWDVRRGIRLWTNPGDVVLSPFAGIGSELYVATELGRRAVGVELKASYYAQAVKNLRAACDQSSLFEAVA